MMRTIVARNRHSIKSEHTFCRLGKEPEMPSALVWLTCALLISVGIADFRRRIEIETQWVEGKDVKTSAFVQRSAISSIPSVCKSQKACPTASGACGLHTGGDCTSFCRRTINQYWRHVSRCHRSPSALGRSLLTTNCETQCESARRQRLKGTPVLLRKDRDVLRSAQCDASCRAVVLSQIRHRRPHALVFAAVGRSSYRSGFHLFAPWV